MTENKIFICEDLGRSPGQVPQNTTKSYTGSDPPSENLDGIPYISRSDTPAQTERYRTGRNQIRSEGNSKSTTGSFPEHTTKRKPGRPRKINPPNRDWPLDSARLHYDGLWYCWPADRDDDLEFERLLTGQRNLYASEGFNSEIAIYEDDLTRRELELRRWGFTPENLLRWADSRPPLTHSGTFTASGIAKARILLVRERLMAGTVEIGRTPDLSKLRSYLGPFLSELLIDRA